MHRLLVLTSLFALSNAGLVRIPKIYNALISSDENLSPSHAIPIVEPVLRTTALGVAFPPIFVHPTLEELPKSSENIDNKKKEVVNGVPETENKKKEDGKPITPQLIYQNSGQPLPFDSYFPYPYTSELQLFPALPYYHQPILVDLEHFNTDNKKKEEQPRPTANFKKNPEIPDVPPPPLPVKDKTQRAA